MTEIRWHGRGGQGAKTAALLLADVAFSTGLNIQGFPEYGPERMGAPITAYNRLDSAPITIHSNIYYPDMVVIVDESLIESVDVTAGLKEGGAILVNSSRSPKELRKLLAECDGDLYIVDANRISKKYLGRNLPNTPLLSAVVRILNIMERDAFFENMKASFAHKFASKQGVIEGNLSSLREAWEGVVKA
ncbi:MAG: 2-oxoacid:acceptor oxidoreductase family protein [Oscillospiraceae bacterium]